MASTTVFCTSGAPAHQRYESWRESIGVIYDVDAGDGINAGFHARVESLIIDDIVLNRCVASQQRFARPVARCATDGIDHYMIQLFLKGSVTLERGRRTVTSGVGALVALDLAENLDSFNTAFDLINLFIPRRRLACLLREPDSLHGLSVDAQSGAGRLLADYLVSLYRAGASLTQADEEAAARVLADLVAAAFNAQPARETDPPAWADHALVLKARAVIAANLHRRDLGPELVARQLNVSRARLYRAFSEIAGVNETIREMRLRRCFSDLISARSNDLHVAEIAYRWGFSDPSHFARAFRTRFGLTASEARARQALTTMGADAESGLDRTWEAWVTAIG